MSYTKGFSGGFFLLMSLTRAVDLHSSYTAVLLSPIVVILALSQNWPLYLGVIKK